MIQPRVVAVVLNWNGWEDTIKCIGSLQKVDYPSLTTIIVDNNSSDGSADKISEQFPSLTLLRQHLNGGYAAGNNAGIRFALDNGAAYVLILNNDTVVDPGFLAPLVAASERMPDVGVVTGRVQYLSHPEQLFSGAGKISRLLCTGMNKGGLFPSSQRSAEERGIDYVCGVMLLVKRSVFEHCGLLDEKYFMYFEDLEFSLRISRRFKIRYIPQSVIYHRSGGGKGWRTYSEKYLYFHTRNRFMVFQEESTLYRMYVALFSAILCVAKSIVIMQNIPGEPVRARRQLVALWKGFGDGLLLFLHRRSGDVQTVIRELSK